MRVCTCAQEERNAQLVKKKSRAEEVARVKVSKCGPPPFHHIIQRNPIPIPPHHADAAARTPRTCTPLPEATESAGAVGLWIGLRYRSVRRAVHVVVHAARCMLRIACRVLQIENQRQLDLIQERRAKEKAEDEALMKRQACRMLRRTAVCERGVSGLVA